ncbi:Solute carrier family 25 member 45 [Takifugu flavidus]|uniref:Solute carrier family 25 member 45 n=1 Tax=Takifugu flavidus TaxID=433684 RepID=A0A5C6MN05_9TELE|nr:Solute carrier family 25 member 45 [Takifugu flavidus]
MPFLDFVAGCISGAMGLTVGHPLDTVKVRLQTQSVYQGLLHCVSETYTHEGLHGFFKGMTFPLLSAGLINSIAFGSYSTALDLLTGSRHSDPSQRKPASAAHVFTAGSFAGLTQLSVSIPIDLVKVRLQGQTSADQYRGSVHCVDEILKKEGPRGLFKGGTALAIRDLLSYGLYFLSYELICEALTEAGKEPGMFSIMTAGGLAGVLSWALATPMDVVKARLQMSEAGGRTYNGILDCMRTSVKEEGVRVFFKGVALNSVRAFPVNAITFLSYERLMKLFHSG